MVPRHDGTRYKQVAVVNPAKCVGCGICVGACDSAGILLGDEPVSLLGQAVTHRLRSVAAAAGTAPVLVYTCRLMSRLTGRLGPDGTIEGRPGITVMGLPCVGTLHPEMIVKTLEAGARGVFIAGCVPEDCPYREGSRWLADRLTGQRLPALKGAPADRLRVRWYSPVEVRRFLDDAAAFQRDLHAAEPPRESLRP
jgi:coenzyme F420-reducing hydrogenase delta subunit